MAVRHLPPAGDLVVELFRMKTPGSAAALEASRRDAASCYRVDLHRRRARKCVDVQML